MSVANQELLKRIPLEIGLILVLEDVVADTVCLRQRVPWNLPERRQRFTPMLILKLDILDAEIFPAIVPATVSET